ncbi:UNVERIFIED_CONTAM: hypothetical protein NCL1_58882 [Trichonephila clavipes]
MAKPIEQPRSREQRSSRIYLENEIQAAKGLMKLQKAVCFLNINEDSGTSTRESLKKNKKGSKTESK